ncbi:hypothetical protein J6590_104863 [Homalodisca vitripennis]|nr:hypothetical protein J6590_104863 [Homalodisca vitripennis]
MTNDFKAAVEKSTTNVSVLEMKLEDFYEWKDFSYTRKKEDPRPYRKDLVRVKAIRGEKTLVYKVDMKDAVEWKVLDFLNKKVQTKGVPFPSPVQICRGTDGAEREDEVSHQEPDIDLNEADIELSNRNVTETQPSELNQPEKPMQVNLRREDV